MLGDDVLDDRPAFSQDQVAILNNRRDPHRVQGLVVVGREPVVVAAVIELERVVEPQFLAQPDDAFGLRNAQVVDGQHGGSPEVRAQPGRAGSSVSRNLRALARVSR